MKHARNLARRNWTALALLLVAARVAAGEAATPPPPLPPTPDQQAAQALLDRLGVEKRIQDEQKRFLAEQHFQVGKTHFELGDFRAAQKQFLKAVELNPQHEQGQTHLRKTQGLLDAQEGRPRAEDLLAGPRIALEMHEMELANRMANAKALFAQRRYAEAIEAFERAAAYARWLAPRLDTSKTFEEAEVMTQRALQAIEAQRRADADEQRRKAHELGEQRQQRGREAADARSQALLDRAKAQYEQGRYDAARKLCDQVLSDDPASGAAEALREQVVETARRLALDKALRARAAETAQYWDGLRAASSPQVELVSITPARLAELRTRKPLGVLGEHREPPPEWETRLRETLTKPVSFDFVETPLQDVLSFLSSLVGTTIVLDPEAVKDKAPSVTLRVNNMRLETALNWVCKLMGLRYSLRDEAIYISNRVDSKPELRMYDVSDITIHIQNFAGRRTALATAEGQGGEGGGSASTSIGADFFPPEDKEKEEKRWTGQELVEFIQRVVAPGTWRDDEAGEGALGRIEVWH
jgi:tetratricopeptide (TPR) repeat protein